MTSYAEQFHANLAWADLVHEAVFVPYYATMATIDGFSRCNSQAHQNQGVDVWWIVRAEQGYRRVGVEEKANRGLWPHFFVENYQSTKPERPLSPGYLWTGTSTKYLMSAQCGAETTEVRVLKWTDARDFILRRLARNPVAWEYMVSGTASGVCGWMIPWPDLEEHIRSHVTVATPNRVREALVS